MKANAAFEYSLRVASDDCEAAMRSAVREGKPSKKRKERRTKAAPRTPGKGHV